MYETEILTRLGLALAAGFLIGVERGWREREEGEGERTAGVRTFALIGLSGGVWGVLSKVLGPFPLGLAFLALAGAVILFRWRETEHEQRFGATTVVAALLTFPIGVAAVVGDMTTAAAAAVATTVLLASKDWLHTWLKHLSWMELRAALILLAMTFVALPLLPDRGFGPYEALNPRSLWLMTIVIAGVSFLGYVALKVAGERYGALIAGIAGGIVSSTVTTLDLARKSKAGEGSARHLLAGAMAASATMFVRVGVVVALFGPSLLPRLVLPLGAAALVLIGVALAVARPWAKAEPGDGGQRSTLRNPFELRAVFGFGALLAVVLVLSKATIAIFGGDGGVTFAAVAGLADVDAITLSMTQLGTNGAALPAAAVAILVAVTANSLSKSALALYAGGRWFGTAYFAGNLAALVAGGLIALAESWMLQGS